MLAAVIYEESYTLYSERHERSIHGVVLQRDGESEEDFYERVKEEIKGMKSFYSYYEYETFYVDE